MGTPRLCLRNFGQGETEMKFETVLFAIAFMALALLSWPENEAGEQFAAASRGSTPEPPQITPSPAGDAAPGAPLIYRDDGLTSSDRSANELHPNSRPPELLRQAALTE